MTAIEETVLNKVLENERASRAVMKALLLVSEIDGRYLTIPDIALMTQASIEEIGAVIRLLGEAGALRTKQPTITRYQGAMLYPRKSFRIDTHDFLHLFRGEEWPDSYEASRLGEAYVGNGEFTLHGFLGQDSMLTRNQYLEARETGQEDDQVARITPKGRAMYVALQLAYPRIEELVAAA